MILELDNEEIYLNEMNTLYKKILGMSYKKEFYEGYIYCKTNLIHTFFCKDKIDIIGINNKNIVIFKYQDAPKNKLIEIDNDKKNTSILVLPNDTSKLIKINDILSFKNESKI